jgi:ELWxxDGT repeat protein
MEHRHIKKLAAAAVLMILAFTLSSSATEADTPLVIPDPRSFGVSLVKNVQRLSVHGLTNADGRLFFLTDYELWASDGTQAGTYRVKLYTNVQQKLAELTYVEQTNTLFFTRHPQLAPTAELWKSDGTEAGTVPVKMDWPGYANAIPEELTNVNGLLFFRLTTGDATGELWLSDGTAAGTKLVTKWSQGGKPQGLTEFNGALYFGLWLGADAGLWKSDGTTDGTVPVRRFDLGSSIDTLTGANGRLFFLVNRGFIPGQWWGALWASDGTEAGTYPIKEEAYRWFTDLIYVKETDTLFFTDVFGWPPAGALWKSDGTEAGTTLVMTEWPGFVYISAAPRDLTNVNGSVFFRLTMGDESEELWVSDGTSAGTTLVRQWCRGATLSGLTEFNGALYFGLSGMDPLTALRASGLWKAAKPLLQIPFGDVTFQLERVRVVDLTGCTGDDDCYGNNDEPYFPMVTFRARLYNPCSTQIRLANHLYEFTDLDEDPDRMTNGAEIPPDAGLVSFTNVHLSTLDSIAEGDFPEVLGVLVLGMEHDSSIGIVRGKIEEKLPDIEPTLQEKIEQGGLVQELANSLNSDSGGSGEPGGDGEQITCYGLEDSLENLPTGWDLDLFKKFIPLFGQAFDFAIEKLADWFIDDFVDAHLFVYFTAKDSAVPNLNMTCEVNNRTIQIKLLGEESYILGHGNRSGNPLVFEGDKGKWEVQLSVTTDATQTQHIHLDAPPDPKPSVSSHRLYLPVIYRSWAGEFPQPSRPGASGELWTIQYNVQFLLPWDDGSIPGEWPNTSQRAVDIGEALACYDIVALDETINDTRRGQIIGSMQARSPYCQRTESLAGDLSMIPGADSTPEPPQADAGQSDGLFTQSFFTAVHGPDITTTHLITGWASAIEAIRDNPGEPLAGNELTIVSRYPIVSTHTHVYTQHYGVDSLTPKGVLHARVRVGEPESPTFIDIFVTHLQQSYADIRRWQIKELADFINQQADPANPVLLLGDFNVDGALSQQEDKNSEYRYLMDSLNSLASGHRIRDIGTHLTGGTNYSSDPSKHRKRRIDYIFLSQSGLTVSDEDVQILDFPSPSGDKPTLSDHAAVAAILKWNQGGSSNDSGGAPDLIVDDIAVTAQDVQIVIRNVGSAPLLAGNDFWVDLYINPQSPPVAVNQIWEDLGDAGLVWGVSTAGLYLAPGDELVLHIGDTHYARSKSRYPEVLPTGSTIYVQVDSANVHTDYGGVLETHEISHSAYNNISSIILTDAVPTSHWASISANGGDSAATTDEMGIEVPRR